MLESGAGGVMRRMKTAVILGLLGFALSAARAELVYTNSPVTAVLELYGELARVELVMASNVATVPYKITIVTKKPISTMTTAEMARIIEEALLEQAGVIITRLKGKQASVTFNDTLKKQVPPGIPLPSAAP